MNKDLEKSFSKYYTIKSGPGSTIEYTQNLRSHLPIIFNKFNIETLLDAPCGDMVWMHLVLEEKKDIKYIGGDILLGLIEKHRQAFKDYPNRNFIHLDITEDAIPTSDLWIVRDVLFHLAPENIIKVFENFLRSHVKYILISSHCAESVGPDGVKWRENRAIKDAEYALLNLFADPYNFPEPLYRFNDTMENHPIREMCLWDRNQIEKWW